MSDLESVSCVVSDGALLVPDAQGKGQDSVSAETRVPLSTLKARSGTFRRAVESSQNQLKFSVVSPAGFFDIWLKSVQGAAAEDVQSQPTAEIFMLLQVRVYVARSPQSCWHAC